MRNYENLALAIMERAVKDYRMEISEYAVARDKVIKTKITVHAEAVEFLESPFCDAILDMMGSNLSGVDILAMLDRVDVPISVLL